VETLRRARRIADEQSKESGRKRIERAAMADPSESEDATNDRDDVM
jgi:hypothetical protein